MFLRMKKTTTARKANRRPACERKNPSGVQNQLSARRSNTASSKRAKNPNMNTTFEPQTNEEPEFAVVKARKNHKSNSLEASSAKRGAPSRKPASPMQAKRSARSG